MTKLSRMLESILKILPLALTATISPTGLFFIMAILSSKEENPRRKALSFLFGSLLFLITLGTLIMVTYHSAVGQAASPGRTSGIIDLILGAVIVLIILHGILFPKKKEDKEAEQKVRKKRKLPYVPLGFVYMITNASTLVPFIAASKMIAEDDLGFWRTLPAFGVLLVITIALISLPVIIEYVSPKRSDQILGPIKRFMSAHGRLLAQVIFLAIAVYLIYQGIGRLNN